MSVINRSCFVNIPPKIIFDLISSIDDYKNFLPWCSYSKILKQIDNVVFGRIDIDYMKVKTSFITKNVSLNESKIEFTLVEGPFKFLHGYWEIIQLNESGCKVNFIITYKFVNIFFEKVINPVFNIICNNIIDSFIKEAKKKHASSSRICQ